MLILCSVVVVVVAIVAVVVVVVVVVVVALVAVVVVVLVSGVLILIQPIPVKISSIFCKEALESAVTQVNCNFTSLVSASTHPDDIIGAEFCEAVFNDSAIKLLRT